jgi:hypothetical protein
MVSLLRSAGLRYIEIATKSGMQGWIRKEGEL